MGGTRSWPLDYFDQTYGSDYFIKHTRDFQQAPDDGFHYAGQVGYQADGTSTGKRAKASRRRRR